MFLSYLNTTFINIMHIIIIYYSYTFTGNFPPPTTPEELGARILIQERYEKFGESEEVEMEVESEDEEDEREGREDGHAAQPDQDTQLQDMDEVRQTAQGLIPCSILL